MYPLITTSSSISLLQRLISLLSFSSPVYSSHSYSVHCRFFLFFSFPFLPPPSDLFLTFNLFPSHHHLYFAFAFTTLLTIFPFLDYSFYSHFLLLIIIFHYFISFSVILHCPATFIFCPAEVFLNIFFLSVLLFSSANFHLYFLGFYLFHDLFSPLISLRCTTTSVFTMFSCFPLIFFPWFAHLLSCLPISPFISSLSFIRWCLLRFQYPQSTSFPLFFTFFF